MDKGKLENICKELLEEPGADLSMVTSRFMGEFKHNPNLRKELFELIKIANNKVT